MTPLLDGYSLATPRTLSEALAMLGAAPDVRPVCRRHRPDGAVGGGAICHPAVT